MYYGVYASPNHPSYYQAFIKDAELIFSNAESYNGPEHDVTHMAQQLKAIFDAWAPAHKVSAAASPQQPTNRPKRERERRELR